MYVCMLYTNAKYNESSTDCSVHTFKKCIQFIFTYLKHMDWLLIPYWYQYYLYRQLLIQTYGWFICDLPSPSFRPCCFLFIWHLCIVCCQVLDLKSDFTSAQLQRANVYLKLAQYREAKEDFLQVVSTYNIMISIRHQIHMINVVQWQ